MFALDNTKSDMDFDIMHSEIFSNLFTILIYYEAATLLAEII